MLDRESTFAQPEIVEMLKTRFVPVAIDQACADLVNQATGLPGTVMTAGHEPGCDKFRSVYPEIDWETTLRQAEELDLGSRQYEIKKLEPLDEKW